MSINSLIRTYFYEKETFIKMCKDDDNLYRFKFRPIRMYRQIATNGTNNEEVDIINGKSLWECNNKYVHKELLKKYETYIKALEDKKKLIYVYNNSKLNILPIQIVLFNLKKFIY